MGRILYISPVKVEGRTFAEVDQNALRDSNELTAIGFNRGPEHVEYHSYEALVLPDLVRSLIEAERQGFDAAVIGCFYDFGLHEGREVCQRMVVTAPCESSVLLACSLGEKFSVIVGRRKWIPQMHGTIRKYGLESRLASFQPLGFGVPDYHVDENETARRFIAAGRKAVEEDGAEVLILGCTASAGFYRIMQDELGVPVIDSALAATKHAEHLIEVRDRFGWSTSKVGGFDGPPEHEIVQYGLREAYLPRDITDVWYAYPVLTRGDH